jgi:hypothetical protein
MRLYIVDGMGEGEGRGGVWVEEETTSAQRESAVHAYVPRLGSVNTTLAGHCKACVGVLAQGGGASEVGEE